MRSEFEEHFSDEDLLKIELFPEAKMWKEIMKFNAAEINFLRKALFVHLAPKQDQETNNLLLEWDAMKEKNELQAKALLKFRNNLEGIRECDDVQCENQYLHDFILLKRTLQQHFNEYTGLKERIYAYFSVNL